MQGDSGSKAWRGHWWAKRREESRSHANVGDDASEWVRLVTGRRGPQCSQSDPESMGGGWPRAWRHRGRDGGGSGAGRVTFGWGGGKQWASSRGKRKKKKKEKGDELG